MLGTKAPPKANCMCERVRKRMLLNRLLTALLFVSLVLMSPFQLRDILCLVCK